MNKRVAGIAAGIAICLAAWVWTILAGGKVQASNEYLLTKYYHFEQLQESEIVQYFTPQYNWLDAVDLFLADVTPDMKGKVCIELTDENNETVFKKKFAVSKIPTGEFYSFKINKKIHAGEQYAMSISYEGKGGDAPQIMVSDQPQNLIETGELYLSEEVSEYNLAVSYHYKWKNKMGWNR